MPPGIPDRAREIYPLFAGDLPAIHKPADAKMAAKTVNSGIFGQRRNRLPDFQSCSTPLGFRKTNNSTQGATQ
jgi:hypothetical protein